MLRYLQTLLEPLRSDPAAPEGGAYPYPTLLPLLQVLATPAEYLGEIPAARWWSSSQIPPPAPYWNLVPTYTYAECPICHTRYQEPADTYTLTGWRISARKSTLYVPPLDFPSQPRCDHLLGVHIFINFHNNAPRELEFFMNVWGEAPYLTPWFLPDDLESYAVLHALPICRIAAESFVPCYTLFVLTYFSVDPEQIFRRHLAEERAFAKGDTEYWPTTMQWPGDQTKGLYELPKWAAAGYLGWLDVSDPALPLRIGSNSEWPGVYTAIAGKHQGMTWRRSKWHG